MKETRKIKLTPFGKEVRKLRIDHDMNLTEMAGILGVSKPYLSHVESGSNEVTKKLLENTIEIFSDVPDVERILTEAANRSTKIFRIHTDENTPDYVRHVVSFFCHTVIDGRLDEVSANEIMEILEDCKGNV